MVPEPAEHVPPPQLPLGPQYWPRLQRAESPLPAWHGVDYGALRADLEYLAELGCNELRLDLRWAEVQPGTQRIETAALHGLERALTLAADFKLSVLIGVLGAAVAGVFHLPDWAVGIPMPLGRVPTTIVIPDQSPLVLAGDRYRRQPVRDLYGDPDLRAAIERYLRETIGSFGRHPAVAGWLLGADLPQLLPFTSHRAAGDWYAALAERARALGAQQVFAQLRPADLVALDRPRPDALQRAGYRLILDLALDQQVPTTIVQWYGVLAGLVHAESASAPAVLVGGLGAPTTSAELRGPLASERFGLSTTVTPLAPELAAEMLEQVMVELYRQGVGGIGFAGYADPAPGLWRLPPLDRSVAARTWGLLDAGGQEKPTAVAVRRFSADLRAGRLPAPGDAPRLPIDPERYWRDPRAAIRDLIDNTGSGRT